MNVDLLACPNCGCSTTDGELCNLTCLREWLAQQNREWLENNNGRPLKDDPDPIAVIV